MENAIVVENLSKKYKGFLLDDVNFVLPKGCIMGFIGENGAGKSTTIKLMLDLIKADSGKVTLLGKGKQDKDLKEQIGVVIDECFYPDNLKIYEIDKMLKKVYKTWNSDVFFKYLEKFSLDKGKMVKELSKGMKMKMMISVALSHNTKLLILDEAISGLDPIVRDEILDIFLEYMQDGEHSIFMSTHITSDLERICDYISFIHEGKLIFTETKDDLLDSFAVLKCKKEELQKLPSNAIKSTRENAYGVEALVYRKKISSGLVLERPSIEDIMLFHCRGGVA